MVARVLGLTVAAAVTGVSSTPSKTPISEVISLLDDLKTKVETEGQTEAQNYDTFACFCKSKTSSRSTSITDTRDDIQTDSSDIASKTATKEEKEEELAKLQKQREQDIKDRDELVARHKKEKAEFEAEQADLANAVRSLNNAINSMENSKSFLAVKETVQRGVALAGVMNLIPEPKRQAISAFLQTNAKVDPNDPVFKYHSQGIIDTLNELLTDFSGQKTDLETEWGKTLNTYTTTKSGLDTKISLAKTQIDNLKDTVIPGLVAAIAQLRTNLVNNEASLKDDQTYMKDLTSMCEARAKDYDQRSLLRKRELEAITQALGVLNSDVATRSASSVARALLQNRKTADVSVHREAPVFLQESMVESAATTEAKAKSAVSALLQRESQRLHSTLLSSTAARIEENPFGEVKRLIQRLIERLIKESAAEATKKGFCDEALASAREDRDFRLEETQDLNQDLEALELKRDELEAEIQMLTTAITKLNTDLGTARSDRAAEKQANLDTIKEAGLGLDAVKRAIVILKVFYKNAAKETVLTQISPVDEDTTGPGFDGAYNGQQTGSKAIIGLLEVIESDFDRTSRTTTKAEADAQAEFILYERDTLADISGKEKKKELDEEDLETTKDTITEKMGSLRTAQSLLDGALKKIETLKPTCIDTTMSYSERVQKRQDELDALKNALCILDTDGVETRCQGGGGQGLSPGR